MMRRVGEECGSAPPPPTSQAKGSPSANGQERGPDVVSLPRRKQVLVRHELTKVVRFSLRLSSCTSDSTHLDVVLDFCLLERAPDSFSFSRLPAGGPCPCLTAPDKQAHEAT